MYICRQNCQPSGYIMKDPFDAGFNYMLAMAVSTLLLRVRVTKGQSHLNHTTEVEH